MALRRTGFGSHVPLPMAAIAMLLCYGCISGECVGWHPTNQGLTLSAKPIGFWILLIASDTIWYHLVITCTGDWHWITGMVTQGRGRWYPPSAAQALQALQEGAWQPRDEVRPSWAFAQKLLDIFRNRLEQLEHMLKNRNCWHFSAGFFGTMELLVMSIHQRSSDPIFLGDPIHVLWTFWRFQQSWLSLSPICVFPKSEGRCGNAFVEWCAGNGLNLGIFKTWASGRNCGHSETEG